MSPARIILVTYGSHYGLRVVLVAVCCGLGIVSVVAVLLQFGHRSCCGFCCGLGIFRPAVGFGWASFLTCSPRRQATQIVYTAKMTTQRSWIDFYLERSHDTVHTEYTALAAELLPVIVMHGAPVKSSRRAGSPCSVTRSKLLWVMHDSAEALSILICASFPSQPW